MGPTRWKWIIGGYSRKRFLQRNGDAKFPFPQSVSIFVHNVVLDHYGSIVEACDSSDVTNFSEKLISFSLERFESLIQDSIDGKKSLSPSTCHVVRSICEMISYLSVTLERTMVTSTSYTPLRSFCEDVFRRLVIPYFPFAYRFSCGMEKTVSVTKRRKSPLNYDLDVLSSSVTTLFSASIRSYFCCLRYEEERDASEIGSIAKCGYFPILFEDENEKEMDGECEGRGERDLKRGREGWSDSVMSDEAGGLCPTLLQFWWSVEKKMTSSLSLPPSPSLSSSHLLFSPSLPLSPSPSLLRLRLSLLPPFMHTIQETMRERERRGEKEKGEEGEKDLEELLSFLLEELKKVSPLFLQKPRDISRHISFFGIFWVSANDYAFSLWKSTLHLLCSIAPPSPLPPFSPTPPLPLRIDSKTGKPSALHSFHSDILRVVLETVFDAFPKSETMEKSENLYLNLAKDTLCRSELYEIKGIKEYLIGFIRSKIRSFYGKVDYFHFAMNISRPHRLRRGRSAARM